MKNRILFFGGIAGGIVTLQMIGSTFACYYDPSFKGSMVIGFAGMFLAFSFIFFAIKRQRDFGNKGYITFWEAFKMGLLITLITSSMYVVAWLVEYYVFIPDFMEKYSSMVLEQAKQEGASVEELKNKSEEMAKYSEMYKNPLWVVVFTYMEIFPVGLVFSLGSALLLKRKAPLI